MYIPSRLKRVILFSGKVDFRKRFDGFLALCYKNNYDPYGGDCILFLSKNKREIRAFFGDNFGLYLVCRRFDGGGIKFLLHKKEFTEGEVRLLFQGTEVFIQNQVVPWKK